MGLVHAEIILRNAGDIASVRRGYIKEPEIRQANVTAMVDTGAATLVILGLFYIMRLKMSIGFLGRKNLW